MIMDLWTGMASYWGCAVPSPELEMICAFMDSDLPKPIFCEKLSKDNCDGSGPTFEVYWKAGGADRRLQKVDDAPRRLDSCPSLTNPQAFQVYNTWPVGLPEGCSAPDWRLAVCREDGTLNGQPCHIPDVPLAQLRMSPHQDMILALWTHMASAYGCA